MIAASSVTVVSVFLPDIVLSIVDSRIADVGMRRPLPIIES